MMKTVGMNSIAESCRMVRGNGGFFQRPIPSESKDRKRKQVDFFRNAA